MPLIYDLSPLLNVERQGTLGRLTAGLSQSSSSPSLDFPCVFQRVTVSDTLLFRAEAPAEGRVFHFAVFSLTASLCKRGLNTV